MIEPDTPQEAAYGRRAGRSVADRNQERARDALENNPLIQALRASERRLEARIKALEGWKGNLQGQNGISVNDNVISIDARSLRPPIQQAPASAASATTFLTQPFQIIPNSNNADETDCVVSPYSVLLEESNVDSAISITGLNTPFTPAISDWVWIEITINPATQTVTAAAIDFGATWTDYPKVYSVNGSDEQITAYCPLAQFAAAVTTRFRPGLTLAGGSIQIIQMCNTHLVMTQLCMDDRSVLFPMPSVGGDIP